MINGLSIAGDVFWIVALALMASFTLTVWKRVGPGARVPVLWRGGVATILASRALALLPVPVIAFVAGLWLKAESGAAHLDMTGALVILGIRLTLAPLVALLQITRLQKALSLMDADAEAPR